MIDVVTIIVVLEFGPVSSPKSYIIMKETHFGRMVTKSVKSPKEKKNIKSESRVDSISFLCKTSTGSMSKACRYSRNPYISSS
jgi:hypothetical protein